MTTPTPERSVEINRDGQDTWEIRYGEYVKGGIFLHDLPKFLNDLLHQTLQAERQKREEVVEAISKSWYKADDVEIRYGFIKSAEYRIKLQALTQPNNPKV